MLPPVAEILTSSLALIIIEAIGGVVLFFGLISYLRNVNVKSQLVAKDAIINTNQQTIEAFEDRLNSLDEKIAAVEADLAEARGENTSLTEELRDWESKYKHLEAFAAPALGGKLLEMFEHQGLVLDKIVNALDGIQLKIDAIESKSE